MALPLAVLLASIMTFGNMGENYELSAIKSAGVSLQRVMVPLMILSLILSVGLFYFSNSVLPEVNLRMRALYYDISNKQPELLIKQGVFSDGIDDFRIKISKKNDANNMMYDFMIYDHKEKRGNAKVTLADSGTIELTQDMKRMVITLYDGKSYEEAKEQEDGKTFRPEHHTFFDKEIISLALSDTAFIETPIGSFGSDYLTKNVTELEHSRDSLKAQLIVTKQKFVDGLYSGRYFKYENKRLEKQANRHDSVDEVVNVDSLFENSNKAVQLVILNSALNIAERNKRYVSINSDIIRSNRKNVFMHEISWHEKFTFPFACLIFFFVGAPLGAIIRKGGFGLPFLVSVVFFLIYYIVTIIGKKFVEEGLLQAWQGMWLSSLVTLPLGLLFTYKATTDSTLFDLSTYSKLIIRPFTLFKEKLNIPK